MSNIGKRALTASLLVSTTRISVLFISGKTHMWEKLASLRKMLGGAYRDRTDDLMLAKQPLSQLS
jgi:hypothetical protein